MLLGLRTWPKNLTDVPGRKTLVLFTSGFPLTSEGRSEVTAAIDACNKANVAVYPIDVRGLTGCPRAALRTARRAAAAGGRARCRSRFCALPRHADCLVGRGLCRSAGPGGAAGGGAAGGGVAQPEVAVRPRVAAVQPLPVVGAAAGGGGAARRRRRFRRWRWRRGRWTRAGMQRAGRRQSRPAASAGDVPARMHRDSAIAGGAAVTRKHVRRTAEPVP